MSSACRASRASPVVCIMGFERFPLGTGRPTSEQRDYTSADRMKLSYQSRVSQNKQSCLLCFSSQVNEGRQQRVRALITGVVLGAANYTRSIRTSTRGRPTERGVALSLYANRAVCQDDADLEHLSRNYA